MRRLLRWLPIVLFLVVGMCLFTSAGRDDKYITYWPAYTLSEFGEMVNYNGDRIEQSSSLLSVLLLAALYTITPFDLPALGWVLSVVSGILAIFASRRLAARIDPRLGDPVALVVATMTCLVYWSFSGMESALAGLLAALLMMAAVDLLREGVKRRTIASFVATAACYLMVRPENALVAIAVSLGFIALLIVRRRLRLSASESPSYLARGSLLLALFTGVFGALVLFRLAYFDSFFPQPVIAKSKGIDLETLRFGYRYVRSHAIVLAYLIPAAAGVWLIVRDGLRGAPLDLHRTFTALFTGAYGGFIITSGGGWMEGGRFFAHLLPAGVVIGMDAIFRLFGASAGRAAAVILAIYGVGTSARLAQTDSLAMPLWSVLSTLPNDDGPYGWIEHASREHRRDMPMVRALDRLVSKIRGGGDRRVAILAHNVGFVAYHTAKRHYGAVRFIDLMGLQDRYITGSPSVRAKIRSTALGLTWGIGGFFENYAQLVRDTGVPYPDVTYCHWEGPTERYGQIRVIWVDGAVSAHSELFPGNPTVSNQILAVEKSLLERVGYTGTSPERIDLAAIEAAAAAGR